MTATDGRRGLDDGSADPTVEGSDGPTALRVQRTRRGFSQAELATHSRISVRTVRALEAGDVRRPRSSTINRLSLTLGLSGPARVSFLSAWGITEQRRVVAPEEVVNDPDKHSALLDSLRSKAAAVVMAMAHNVTTVDRDGLITAQQTNRLVTAESSGVRGTSTAWFFDSPEQADSCRIGQMHGCTLGREVRLDSTTTMADIDFDRVLAAGEAHYFGYTRWIGPSGNVTSDGVGAPWQGRHVEIGGHAGFRVCIQEVRFSAGRRPRRCVHLERHALDVTADIVGDLPLSADGMTRLSLVEPGPGWHGVGWIW